MPLSSPSNPDIDVPTQQLLRPLTHSAFTSIFNRTRRRRPYIGAFFASRPAGPAASLRPPKHHEWPHEAGAEAETRVAEEDEE